MLFSNFKIKSFTFKNRIVMAPMCMYQANNFGLVNDFHLIHYGSRAIAGVSCIILEATAVEARGRITDKDLCIYSDEHIPGLRVLARNIKKYGAIAGIQLGHAGRKSQTRSNIIAPSPLNFPNIKTPNEMSIEDIQIVIHAFKCAANRAHLAGFDLIEIHAAHGYLINQFLSNLTNKRTDHYGGSLNNRIRFLSEIIYAINEVWPKDKILGIRFSADEYHKKGNKVDDIIYIINYLKSKGLDYINVSSGGVIQTKINTYPGYQLEYARKIKEQTSIPVIGGGLITTAKQANEAIQTLNIDLIYFGRVLLRNPNFPHTAAKELKIDFEPHPAYLRAKE